MAAPSRAVSERAARREAVAPIHVATIQSAESAASPTTIASATSTTPSSSSSRIVHVKTTYGKTITLTGLDDTDTVDDVKHRVQACEHIPPDQQRLIYAGRQLADAVVLAGTVPRICTMHLILRLRGD